MGPNKAVHLMFMAGFAILAVLLSWTGDWVWGYWSRNPNDFIVQGSAILVAGVIAIMAYRSERVHGLAVEVASELRKVSWPTRKETQAATLVVIVTVIIAAVVLGTFDMLWSYVTDRIYG
jgi:preprotein translocase subunit SecE